MFQFKNRGSNVVKMLFMAKIQGVKVLTNRDFLEIKKMQKLAQNCFFNYKIRIFEII